MMHAQRHRRTPRWCGGRRFDDFDGCAKDPSNQLSQLFGRVNKTWKKTHFDDFKGKSHAIHVWYIYLTKYDMHIYIETFIHTSTLQGLVLEPYRVDWWHPLPSMWHPVETQLSLIKNPEGSIWRGQISYIDHARTWRVSHIVTSSSDSVDLWLQWSFSLGPWQLKHIFLHVPSWALTYPLARYFWKWLSLSQGMAVCLFCLVMNWL